MRGDRPQRLAPIAFAGLTALAALGACSLVVSTDGLAGADDDGGSASEAGASEAGTGGDTDARSQTDGSDASPIGCPASEPGLLVYYRFDETEGTVAHDCSGNRSDGNVVSPQWASGKRNGALRFDGAGTCVQVGSSTSILKDGAFTVAAFVNVTQFADTSSTKARYLVAKANEVPDKSAWRFGSDAVSSFSVKLGEPLNAVEVRTSDGQPSGKWLHVASVFDPGKRLEIWIDGALAGQAPVPPAAITDDPAASVHIGCLKSSAFFDGLIDEMRIYSRALSRDEIIALSK